MYTLLHIYTSTFKSLRHKSRAGGHAKYIAVVWCTYIGSVITFDFVILYALSERALLRSMHRAPRNPHCLRLARSLARAIRIGESEGARKAKGAEMKCKEEPDIRVTCVW